MKKTKIIAEIAQGYEGNYGLCEKFVKVAKNCGADGIKFQIFEAEEICTPTYEYYDFFKSLYIEPYRWIHIINLCKKNNLSFYADIFGIKTLEWILKTDIAGIKIHGTDIRNYSLIEKLKGCNKEILIGAGGSTLEEIKTVLEILNGSKTIVMLGFQSEPNIPSDIQLNKISIVKNKWNTEIGYADHLDANDPLSVYFPSMAVLFGATYIEKHLTLERNILQLEDHISALNPDQFIQMVQAIRKVEEFPDPENEDFILTEREKEYRIKSKKAILAAHDLKKGHVLSSEDIVLLRTHEKPTEILNIDEVVGKKINCDLKKFSLIKKEYLS